MKDIVRQDIIEKKIFLIFGLNVMLNRDLTELFGVTTKRLIEQVKRNIKSFLENFIFQLIKGEF